MAILITPYSEEYETALFEVLTVDPDWHSFDSAAYRSALLNSPAFIAMKENHCCGYIRAIDDHGLGLYISELYVIPPERNKKIGERLLYTMIGTFPRRDIYVLSDEDGYYLKKGFERAGSVFILREKSEIE